MKNEISKNKKRVIVGMSGGVDSSVAAALLKEQGFEVIGIFMKLWAEPKTYTSDVAENRSRENICCSVEASTAARAVAEKLSIPFYVVNFADDFKKMVVENYIAEYEAGRTPNPCVICNRDIKGQLLLKKAEELGGDFLATGHYARIVRSKTQDTIYKLMKAKDQNKDQTYFLWTLTQEKLSKFLFPCGDYTKPEIRDLARKFNLPTAEKRESQGICFIPDRNVSGFLHRHAKKLLKQGPIVDIETNNNVGQHQGLINYTIGPREGLGIGGPKAYYVVKLDMKSNTLIVGHEKDLYSKKLVAGNLNIINQTNDYSQLATVSARIRHGHPIVLCTIKAVDESRIAVNFSKPQRAITPGQSIVFYQGDEVLGGGLIE